MPIRDISFGSHTATDIRPGATESHLGCRRNANRLRPSLRRMYGGWENESTPAYAVNGRLATVVVAPEASTARTFTVCGPDPVATANCAPLVQAVNAAVSSAHWNVVYVPCVNVAVA